jgi:hypothetical protein
MPYGDVQYTAACLAIGEFVIEFSRLESFIRATLADVLRLEDRYSEIVGASYDFATLCRVTRTVLQRQFPDEKDDIKRLFDTCLRVNDARVRLAHGTWAESAGGLIAAYMSRQSLKVDFYFGDIKEVRALAGEATELAKEVVSLAPMVRNYRAQQQEKPADPPSPAN